MKYFVLLFTLLANVVVVSAQKPLVKWGKVPSEDLQMTQYEADPEADAVVLNDHGLLRVELVGDDVRYRFIRHRRVKLLKESAFSRATVHIPYYAFKRNPEKITSLKAQTLSPEGKKSVVRNKAINDIMIDSDWAAKVFTFPNVQEGSILEYRYEIVSGRITELRDWYFQEDLPIRLSELQVEVPNWFTYVYLFEGQGNIQQEEVDEKTIDVRGNPFVKVNSNIYRMENVAALPLAPFITTMNDYRARMRFQLKEINYPDGSSRPYLTSWEDVAKDLLADPRFGLQFNEPINYRALLNPTTKAIINSSATQMEKAVQLANYLANQVNWNQQYHYLANTSLNDALNSGSANSGEFNLMLLSLLREANIQANPLLVSTRSKGKPVQRYPMVNQFNHVLVHANLDGTDQVLDASDETLRPLNMPRVDACNENAWMVGPEHTEWIDLQPELSTDIYRAEFELSPEGALVGQLECHFKGYHAFEQRKQFKYDSEGKLWKASLKERFPGIRIDSFAIANIDDINQKFQHTVFCTIPLAANNQQFSMPSVLYSSIQLNPFVETSRTIPVELAFPHKEIFILQLSLPENWTIEQKPESTQLSLPEEGGKMQYLVNHQNNTLQVSSKVQFKQLKYFPAEYLDLRDLFDQIIQRQQSPIVFRKTDG
ncbi:MAG: DUF3857 domain-containing protein [Bacteroidota bacterium]